MTEAISDQDNELKLIDAGNAAKLPAGQSIQSLA